MMLNSSVVVNPVNGMEYFLVSRLGDGAFGEVWRGRTRYNQEFAIKFLKPNDPNINLQTWSNEVNIGAQCAMHPHIVSMHDHFFNVLAGQYVIVMELAEGNLEALLHPVAPVGNGLIQAIGCQILLALNHLHSLPNAVIHRDVSPRNILRFGNGIYKLSDFGISRQLASHVQINFGKTGLPNMLLPELIASGYSSVQSDIYQLGFVLLTLLLRNYPINLNIPQNQVQRMIEQGVPRQLAEQNIPVYGKIAEVISIMPRRRLDWRYKTAMNVYRDLQACQ